MSGGAAVYADVLVVGAGPTGLTAACELLLLELLHRLGGRVERPVELVDLQQDPDRVVASVRDPREEAAPPRQIRAGWVIGCDGAHSVTRKRLGIDFVGESYPEQFLLADVDLDWKWARDESHAWLHADGILGALPLPQSSRWRLFVDLASTGSDVPRPSLELFQSLLEERTDDHKTIVSNPSWMSAFKISRRMVGEYRRGRVFLAGDAAHIHSPFGGQGMNTGIQDGYNLAWKLALQLQGVAAPGLLDSFQEERLPVARAVLHGTDTATYLMITRNSPLRFVRDHLLLRLAGLGVVQEMMVQRASELRINYRHSPLSASH